MRSSQSGNCMCWFHPYGSHHHPLSEEGSGFRRYRTLDASSLYTKRTLFVKSGGSHSGSPGVMSNLHVPGEGVEPHDHAVLSTVFLGSQLPLFPDFAIRFDRFSSCQRRTAFQVCVGFSPPRSPRGSPPSPGSRQSSCLSSP